MRKNDGFIATSMLYTFFLVFCAVLMGLIVSFLHNRILLSSIVDGVKTDLTKIGNRTLKCVATELGTNNCIPVKQGDYIKMTVTPTTIFSDTTNLKWIVTSNITSTSTQVSLISDDIFMMTNNYYNQNNLNSILATFNSGTRVSIRTPNLSDTNTFEAITTDSIKKVLTGAITVSSHPSASTSVPGEFIIFNGNTTPILYKYTCLLSNNTCRANRYNIPSGRTTQYGIRAIITLYTTRKIISGNGSLNDPFILEVT